MPHRVCQEKLRQGVAMFGYVTINKPELKIREFDTYQSWYCGLCHVLHREYGRMGQMTLSYDMTFLVLVLHGLYEPELKTDKRRCLTHPAMKHPMRMSRFTEYGADMNVLLAYHNFMDDWTDEKKLPSLTAARALEGRCRRAAEKYPRQNRAIVRAIRKLSAYEKDNEMNIDKVSGMYGRIAWRAFCLGEGRFCGYAVQDGLFSWEIHLSHGCL